MKRIFIMAMLFMMLGAFTAQAALNDLEKEMVGRFTAQTDEVDDDGLPVQFNYVFEFKADKTFTIDIIMDQTAPFGLDVTEAENAEQEKEMAEYSNAVIVHATQTLKGKWRCTTHSIILDDGAVVDRKVEIKMQKDDEIGRMVLANVDKDEIVDEPLTDKTILIQGKGQTGGKEFELSFNEVITFMEDSAGNTLELYAEE
ncbi:MAG: hypothetical protein IKX39_01170 [Muribaculaceae bacterium]|nr:hypothetical protein [Muribaculaceae bacterium]